MIFLRSETLTHCSLHFSTGGSKTAFKVGLKYQILSQSRTFALMTIINYHLDKSMLQPRRKRDQNLSKGHINGILKAKGEILAWLWAVQVAWRLLMNISTTFHQLLISIVGTGSWA